MASSTEVLYNSIALDSPTLSPPHSPPLVCVSDYGDALQGRLTTPERTPSGSGIAPTSPLCSPMPIAEVQLRHRVVSGLDAAQRKIVMRRQLEVTQPTQTDREKLRCFGLHGGFLSNANRVLAYPQLLGLPLPLTRMHSSGTRKEMGK